MKVAILLIVALSGAAVLGYAYHRRQRSGWHKLSKHRTLYPRPTVDERDWLSQFKQTLH